jgi:HEAT repeat protein
MAGDGGAPETLVQALIELTADSDAEVRDWATAGLGSMLDDEDSAAIRDALAGRLDDSDAEVRGEALRGLAVRGDSRALDAIDRELRGQPAESAVDAAEVLGDSRLEPALRALRDRGWAEDETQLKSLEEAIEALARNPR